MVDVNAEPPEVNVVKTVEADGDPTITVPLEYPEACIVDVNPGEPAGT